MALEQTKSLPNLETASQNRLFPGADIIACSSRTAKPSFQTCGNAAVVNIVLCVYVILDFGFAGLPCRDVSPTAPHCIHHVQMFVNAKIEQKRYRFI